MKFGIYNIGGLWFKEIHAGHPIFTDEIAFAKPMSKEPAMKLVAQLKAVGYPKVSAKQLTEAMYE